MGTVRYELHYMSDNDAREKDSCRFLDHDDPPLAVHTELLVEPVQVNGLDVVPAVVYTTDLAQCAAAGGGG